MDYADWFYLLTCFFIGYIVGSVNFAVLVCRQYGVNILKEGSGNPGATNVKRVLGKGPGNIVFALDAAKGMVGTVLPIFAIAITLDSFNENSMRESARTVFEYTINGDGAVFPFLATGFVGTLLGHCFSVFLKFKGGKGVASTIGGLIVLLPLPIAIGGLIWAALFYYTRYVSVASMALGISLPLSCFLLNVSYQQGKYSYLHIGFATAIAIFNIWTHRTNIVRLIKGQESRFTKNTGPYS
jgi:glycerol-3-phosphate acyltransferase PlsY